MFVHKAVVASRGYNSHMHNHLLSYFYFREATTAICTNICYHIAIIGGLYALPLLDVLLEVPTSASLARREATAAMCTNICYHIYTSGGLYALRLLNVLLQVPTHDSPAKREATTAVCTII